MQPTERHISTIRTARYYSFGSFDTANEVWFVLHGYGQRAEQFINCFQPLADEKRLIIAPEALSRFYTSREFGGSIGASWMTREDRLNEIRDYIVYLDALYQEITTRFVQSPTKIVTVGFSQGVPALLRWIAAGCPKPNTIIMSSGDVPRDLDFVAFEKAAKNAKKLLLIGDNDKLVRPEIYSETETLLTSAEITYTKHIFSGGHEMNSEAIDFMDAEA